jgi:hypothetical protein
MSQSLASYCQGFVRSAEPWPQLPLADEPELAWWRRLIGSTADGILSGEGLVSALQKDLPQLHLPQEEGISNSELYRALVLRGEEVSASCSADGPSDQSTVTSWHQAKDLRLWIAAHPCGAMPVLETPNREDFVHLVRALAHRSEPVTIANAVHAQAISGLIHWGLIQQCGRQSRASLIVLHKAPYGSVPSSLVPGGHTEPAWLAASTTLRVEHELTHLATKRLLGEMRPNLLDELIADCMGMVAALGSFNAELFGRCLGIDDRSGRWTSYTVELTQREAQQALDLAMARALELEEHLRATPELLKTSNAMRRLQWLTSQKLDQALTSPSRAKDLEDVTR